MNLIQQIEAENIAALAKEIPDFRPGDTLRVGVKVVEGERSRVQNYEGVCIARSNKGMGSNFTVRKISVGEGVVRVVGIAAYVGLSFTGLVAVGLFFSTLTEVPVGAMAATDLAG